MKRNPQTRATFGIIYKTLLVATLSSIGVSIAKGVENEENNALRAAAQRIVAACIAKIQADPSHKNKKETVHIDPFVDGDGNPSYGLRREIEKEFKNKGYHLVSADDSNFRLRGTISKDVGNELPDDDIQSPALKIEGEVVNNDGDPLWFINPIRVYTRDALQQLAPNFSVAPDLPLETQVENLLEHLDHPKPIVDRNNLLYPREESHFGIEIRVAGQTRPIFIGDGLRSPTVYFNPGEEYRVLLHNQAPFTVGVRLLIDGVSMFVMSEDVSEDSLILVPPGKNIEVAGWWIRAQGKGMTAFKAGEPAASVAAQLNRSTSDMGTISAAFYAAWSEDGPPPEDEALGTRGNLGTQQGTELTTNNPVVKNMVFGSLRSAVSVSYESASQTITDAQE